MKKFFLGKKAKQARAKSLEELKKNDLEIEDPGNINGGASDRPNWLEVPAGPPVKSDDPGLPGLI